MKRMVTACEPGENGVQRVWDFGGLELRDANYELKYVLQGTDTVIGTEHCTMYYYRTSGDSLFVWAMRTLPLLLLTKSRSCS